MVRYETLMLTVPEITSDESSSLEKTFQKLVKEAKGSLISFERWGKLRLAYPIQDNDYGVYFLTRFEVDDEHKQSFLEQLKSLFDVKYRNLVMRDMSTHLAEDAPLAYQRPESLEDIPTRDVDQFLRENKMEGLLSSVSEKEVASGEKATKSKEVETVKQETEQEKE